jgi:hypothetical protein
MSPDAKAQGHVRNGYLEHDLSRRAIRYWLFG